MPASPHTVLPPIAYSNRKPLTPRLPHPRPPARPSSPDSPHSPHLLPDGRAEEVLARRAQPIDLNLVNLKLREVFLMGYSPPPASPDRVGRTLGLARLPPPPRAPIHYTIPVPHPRPDIANDFAVDYWVLHTPLQQLGKVRVGLPIPLEGVLFGRATYQVRMVIGPIAGGMVVWAEPSIRPALPLAVVFLVPENVAVTHQVQHDLLRMAADTMHRAWPFPAPNYLPPPAVSQF